MDNYSVDYWIKTGKEKKTLRFKIFTYLKDNMQTTLKDLYNIFLDITNSSSSIERYYYSFFNILNNLSNTFSQKQLNRYDDIIKTKI
jgi:hypothetical protein